MADSAAAAAAGADAEDAVYPASLTRPEARALARQRYGLLRRRLLGRADEEGDAAADAAAADDDAEGDDKKKKKKWAAQKQRGAKRGAGRRPAEPARAGAAWLATPGVHPSHPTKNKKPTVEDLDAELDSYLGGGGAEGSPGAAKKAAAVELDSDEEAWAAAGSPVAARVLCGPTASTTRVCVDPASGWSLVGQQTRREDWAAVVLWDAASAEDAPLEADAAALAAAGTAAGAGGGDSGGGARIPIGGMPIGGGAVGRGSGRFGRSGPPEDGPPEDGPPEDIANLPMTRRGRAPEKRERPVHGLFYKGEGWISLAEALVPGLGPELWRGGAHADFAKKLIPAFKLNWDTVEDFATGEGAQRLVEAAEAKAPGLAQRARSLGIKLVIPGSDIRGAVFVDSPAHGQPGRSDGWWRMAYMDHGPSIIYVLRVAPDCSQIKVVGRFKPSDYDSFDCPQGITVVRLPKTYDARDPGTIPKGPIAAFPGEDLSEREDLVPYILSCDGARNRVLLHSLNALEESEPPAEGVDEETPRARTAGSLREFRSDFGWPWQLAVLPDGRRVAAGCDTGYFIFDAMTGERVASITSICGGWCGDVAFDNDGLMLSYTRNSEQLHVYDLAVNPKAAEDEEDASEPLLTLPVPFDPRGISLDPNHNLLYTCGEDGTLLALQLGSALTKSAHKR